MANFGSKLKFWHFSEYRIIYRGHGIRFLVSILNPWILNPKVGPISRLVTTYYPFSRFQFSTFFHILYLGCAFVAILGLTKWKNKFIWDKDDILINIRCNQIWPFLATCQILHMSSMLVIRNVYNRKRKKMFVVNIGGTRLALELKGTTHAHAPWG